MVRVSPAPSTRSGRLPAAPSCTSRPSCGAASPASSTACAVPTLGWPANGTSWRGRSEEHTSELQSLMRISYAVLCLKKKKTPHVLDHLIHYDDVINTQHTTHCRIKREN